MRHFSADRGFLTFAQNSGDADYLRMAYALALSLKATQAKVARLSVIVTPGTQVPDKWSKVFDQVIDVPWLDEARDSAWKLENEWKAYHATPYRETIKLDADMLFPCDIGSWWDIMARQDVCITETVETYRGDVVTSDAYRKVFTVNQLPNVYTGLMYFKYCDMAEELFSMAEMIFHNWDKFAYDYLLAEHRPKQVSTDVVFALAVKLLGLEDAVLPLPGQSLPRFVHMKSQLQGWPDNVTEDWPRHVMGTLLPNLDLKVGLYTQHRPFHYQIKEFLTNEMIATYEKALGL